MSKGAFGSSSRTDCGIFICVSPFGRLCAHSDDQLAEVASLQHADESFGRVLQIVDEVFAITDAAIGDAGADFA